MLGLDVPELGFVKNAMGFNLDDSIYMSCIDGPWNFEYGMDKGGYCGDGLTGARLHREPCRKRCGFGNFAPPCPRLVGTSLHGDLAFGNKGDPNLPFSSHSDANPIGVFEGVGCSSGFGNADFRYLV